MPDDPWKSLTRDDPWKSLTRDVARYPNARRNAVVDVIHGVKVADPYRWLEDPDSADSRAWIEAENKITFGWLDQVEQRPAIRQRLTELWDFEKFGLPFKEGGRYFYDHNPGLLNQSQLFTVDKLDGTPRLLLDANTLSSDGTVAVSGYGVSHDGKYLAYSLSSGGSDWQEWHVRDVATGMDLPDVIKWSKFSGASWRFDQPGFYYSAYDPPKNKDESLTEANYFQKLYFHTLGQPQEKDLLVYQRPDQKEWGFSGVVTDDGRYLIIQVWKGTDPKSGLFYLDLKAKQPAVVELLKDFDAAYTFVGNDGPIFFVRTDRDATRSRLVAIDIRQPGVKKWKQIIPQAAATLENVSYVGGRLVADYVQDAHSLIKVYEKSGKPVSEVALPGIGSAGGFGGRFDDSETFYSYTSFNQPAAIYRYDVRTGQSTLFRAPKVKFDPAGFETRQIFYNSKDGTRVPMFIVHKKGLAVDANTPTLLYGYGGFNVSITPYFSVSTLVWMEMGGQYAVANIRGGNEYGEEWHLAGTKLNKQNVFDDFIAGAEWLIANKQTSPRRLAISGGSNGGLLVGACLVQRPELFAAATPMVGVLDMLRYHTWTIGWAWSSDYGTVDEAEQFKALYAYSPYHNVKPARYPAVFITTGDHDDRVMPAHSFKFAAALQQAQAGPAPILIRIETRAGHGAGKPTQKIIDESADRLSFLVRTLDVKGATP